MLCLLYLFITFQFIIAWIIEQIIFQTVAYLYEYVSWTLFLRDYVCRLEYTIRLNACSSDSLYDIINSTIIYKFIAIFESLTFSTIFPTLRLPRHIPRSFVARCNKPATNPQIRSLGRPIRVLCVSSTLCPQHVFFHTTLFHVNQPRDISNFFKKI